MIGFEDLFLLGGCLTAKYKNLYMTLDPIQ